MTERARRIDLIRQTASKLGFSGRVEYWHTIDPAGPAQLRLGVNIRSDVMRVFAPAFQWESNPDDFSLTAIIAHECGHQVIHRHRIVRRWLLPDFSLCSEEVAASLIGASLAISTTDRNALVKKAMYDAIVGETNPSVVFPLVEDVQKVLELALCSETNP